MNSDLRRFLGRKYRDCYIEELEENQRKLWGGPADI
jgi:hypothetical protein